MFNNPHVPSSFQPILIFLAILNVVRADVALSVVRSFVRNPMSQCCFSSVTVHCQAGSQQLINNFSFVCPAVAFHQSPKTTVVVTKHPAGPGGAPALSPVPRRGLRSTDSLCFKVALSMYIWGSSSTHQILVDDYGYKIKGDVAMSY